MQVERYGLNIDLNDIKELTEQTELDSKFQIFGLILEIWKD